MSAETIIRHTDERLFTAQEYLERERDAETKSEFHAGRIVAMAGATHEHDDIVVNLSTVIGSQIFDTPCRGKTSDMRVWVPACDKYLYPDYGVVCEEPEYQLIAGVESLRNPSLVIEVLSETTAAFDRGEKRECYQTLSSMNTYVIVSQDRPYIEIYRRSENGWVSASISGLEAIVSLPEIGCVVPMRQVYHRITFPPSVAATVIEPANGR